MERQRSFSLKPTRLLLFSLTIPSSILFCFLFSSWALSSTPSPSSEAHLQFSHSGKDGKVPVLGHPQLEPALVPVSNEKDSILDDSYLRNAINFSQGSPDLVGERRSSDLDGQSSGPITVEDIEEKSSESDEESERKYGGSDAYAKNNIASVVGMVGGEVVSSCDVSNGKWVFDEGYPLYTKNTCPYIDEGFSCETNGRLDRDYMKWRWQPNGCNIPRFNPERMLELIRGKRLVFVGDSINRNQWESMLCMLRGAVKDPSRVYEARGRRITKNRGNYNFKFRDYHCSVEYYVSHFLVHEGKARVGQRRVKTLRIDTLDRSSSRWRGADILVFNTAHWWSHYKTKAGVNYYQEGDQVHPRLDVSSAFRKALMTWASWVDQHVTPSKTQVFFRSSSPSHFRGGEWNSGGHCKESSQPLNDTSGRQIPEKNMILEEVVKKMRTPVTILNITSLSGLRIDGHPSIYGRNPGRGLPSDIQDCSHWCLPGVPDTWNELLYFYLLSQHKPFFTN